MLLTIIVHYAIISCQGDYDMATAICDRKRGKRHRTSLSITIDPHVLDNLKQWMKKEGETNLSSVIEGFIDCGIRDSCDDCPFYADVSQEEKARVGKKIGVDKWAPK